MEKTLAPPKTSSPSVTECTQSSFSFARHFRRQVSAQFDGGMISSDGADRNKKIGCDPAAIERLLVDVFVEAHGEAPEQIILDIDTTDTPLHGQQEGRFFHGYYGHYCYLPLYIFSGQQVLCARQRVANQDAAAGSLEELQRIVKQIRKAWPKVKIVLRADSGFCRDELLSWCEQQQLDYVVGLARNPRLRKMIEDEMAEAAEQQQRMGEPARVFAELAYQTLESCSRARRVVAKAEQPTADDRCALYQRRDPGRAFRTGAVRPLTRGGPRRQPRAGTAGDPGCRGAGGSAGRIYRVRAGPEAARDARSRRLRLHGPPGAL